MDNEFTGKEVEIRGKSYLVVERIKNDVYLAVKKDVPTPATVYMIRGKLKEENTYGV